MTITNQNTEITYTGNGATIEWAFTFEVPDADSMHITLIDNTGAVPVETVLSPALYSVEGYGEPSGGTVTYPIDEPPITSDYEIRIRRLMAYTQETDLTNQDNFYPEVLEGALDRIVMQIQQLANALGSSEDYGSLAEYWAGIAQGFAADAAESAAEAEAARDYLRIEGTTFAGDGVTTTFPLPFDPVVAQNMFVSLDGVVQVATTDYTVVGTDLVFVEAPPYGVAGYARAFATRTVLPSIAASDVTFDNTGTGLAAGNAQAALAELAAKSHAALVATDFGATGDGVTDDTAALQTAIDAAETAGKSLYVPTGVYMVSDQGGAVALFVKAGVDIFGAGPGATQIKLAAGGNAHVFAGADGVHFWSIRNMLIDGDRVNQTLAGTHCIRFGGCVNVLLDNLWIRNASHYNIGIQDGINDNVHIQNIRMSGSGGDAIDIKTKGSVTASASSANEGVFLTNIWVENFGMDAAIIADSSQAAIDLRGIVFLSNIYVKGIGANKLGVRFRWGEAGDEINYPNGVGATQSMLSNFNLQGDGNGVGLSLEHTYIRVTNGNILSCEIGVGVYQHECSVDNVQTLSCPTGFLLEADSGLITSADRTTLTACRARSSTVVAFNVETVFNSLVGCSSNSCTLGILLPVGADNNSVVGGAHSSNTSNLSNSGAGNRFQGAIGITDV